MRKIYKAALLFTVLYAGMEVLSSCNKDWLTPQVKSLYSTDALVDVPGFKAALAGCAVNLRNEFYGDGAPIGTELLFSEVTVEGTDDKTGPAQNLDVQIKPDAQLNSVDYNRIGWYWTQEYYGIREANTIIARLPKATSISDSLRNILMGQAYFFRAFDYYRLTHQFGDVPCPTKEILTPKTDFVTVKREVILQQMKTDLETAVKYVPWATDKGEVSRAACYHLLAKIDLALGLFDDAIAATSAIINQGSFKLMTSRFGDESGAIIPNVIWDLHRPLNKSLPGNSETIFLVTDRYGTPGAFSGGILTMRQSVPYFSGGKVLTPSGNAGIATTTGIEIDNYAMYGRGIGRVRSTPYHYKDIWDDPSDLRHDSTSGNWMYMENLRYNNPSLKTATPPAVPDTAYGLRVRLYGPTGTLLCGDTLRQWFPWPHYKVYIVPDLNSTPIRGGNTDWYVFRLAETYLLRAEAYVWKGDNGSAVADLNKVRTRAGCAPYTAAQMSIGTILDERARELYYEEARKTELTRMAYIFAKTGQSYNGKTYTVANFSTSNFMVDRILEKNYFYKTNFVTVHGDQFRISQYHVLWPVPQDAILANLDGHINQNIGYTGSASNVPPSDKIVD